MGDFNARTGNLNDNYEASVKIDDNIPIVNPFSELLKRNNCDSVINSHGEKIIKMCKTYDFKMLNGRTKGDSVGNYTHFNNNKGTSTVDYSLCNQHIYKYVENFVILPMNELSDHSKIVTFLKSIPQNKVHDDYDWKKLKLKFIWDNKSRGLFGKNLLQDQHEIDEIAQRIEAGLIESTGEMIQKLFYNAALQTFKQKILKTQKDWKKKKKNGKKWFDTECNDLKKSVRNLGREKYIKTGDSLLKVKYHEKLNEYKKKCKFKKYKFWENTSTEINNSLDDPINFWKKWKKLDECHTPVTQHNVTGEKWHDYFKNLHTETTTVKMMIIEIQ